MNSQSFREMKYALCSSIKGLVRSILEMFPGENVVSREFNRDLWNPFENKDVVEMDRADCGFGRSRYSTSKNFFM